jgi:hypothetical protein
VNEKRNIIVFSEMDHRQKTADSIRLLTSDYLASKLPINYYFIESSIADNYVLREIDRDSSLISKTIKNYAYVLKTELFNSELNEIRQYYERYRSSVLYRDRSSLFVKPIDIGTILTQFSIAAIGYLTKEINIRRIDYIDKFSDSVILNHAQLFNEILFSEISDYNFGSFEKSFNKFFSLFKQNYPEKAEILLAWKSLFDEFQNKYYGKAFYAQYKSAPGPFNYGLFLHYRDSIMFENLDLYLNKENVWKNVIISISSLHSIKGYKDREELGNFISDNYTTFGQRLTNQYDTIVKRIAIVCYKCCTGDLNSNKSYSNNNFKKSIEYMIAKKYHYAYVSLSDIRNDKSLENYRFFLRPTFSSFIKSGWQHIFDGIIFVRDCECK